jgi:hypothetical protein
VHTRKAFAMLGAACLPAAVLILGLLGPSHAPERAAAAQTQDPTPPQARDLRYLGVRFCIGCHTQKNEYEDDYVELNEYLTWKTEDKHSLAYINLTGERGRRMGQILGYNVTDDARCLSCHGLANVPENQRANEFHKENGVSCEGCHGPAQKWGAEHSSKDWRLVTFQEKQAKGMVNVRDPAERTQICASCHIGSVQERKVVTHEMYAAGHPPLPGFELATFSERLPRHWRLRKDIPYLRDTAPKAVKDRFDFQNATFENTKLVLVSSVVAVRDAMAFLERRARDDSAARDAAKAQRSPWPDYAQFDCYACHHDLKVPSWRQARGYVGAPGRPQVRPWPLALVELAVRHTAKDDASSRAETSKLQMARRALDQATSAQPFGDPAQVSAAASGLKSWAESLVSRTVAADFDPTAALRLLKTLCAMAAERAPDYDSARQIAWAFQVIYSEWRPHATGAGEIRSILESLQSDLHLALNSTRAERKAIIAKTDFSKQALPTSLEQFGNKELAQSLERIADYDPKRFQDAMQKLAQQLPPGP